MPIESLIRNANQVPIKARLSGSALVSARKQDRLALWIEGVGYTPCTSIGIKSQFLHVRVARSFESVCLRSSEQWAILTEDSRRCLQLFSNSLGKLPNFLREFVVEFDHPFLVHSMLWNA